MITRRILIAMIATLVGTVAGGIFAGSAQAGITSFPRLGVKCYEANSPALNQHLRLFDVFHDGAVSPDEGGELVTLKGSKLVCTAISAKCLLDRDPPLCFTGSASPIDVLNCYKIAPSGPPVGETVRFSDNGSIIHIPQQDLVIGGAQYFCEGGNAFPVNP